MEGIRFVHFKLVMVVRHHVFEAINGSYAKKSHFLQLCTTEEKLRKITILSGWRSNHSPLGIPRKIHYVGFGIIKKVTIIHNT